MFPSWAEPTLSREHLAARAAQRSHPCVTNQRLSGKARVIHTDGGARESSLLQGNFPDFSSFLKTITQYCSYRVVVCGGGLLKWGRTPLSLFLSSLIFPARPAWCFWTFIIIQQAKIWLRYYNIKPGYIEISRFKQVFDFIINHLTYSFGPMMLPFLAWRYVVGDGDHCVETKSAPAQIYSLSSM